MKTIGGLSRLPAAVVLAMLLPALHSAADIGIFGGVGQTVFPIRSEEVRMVSEKVTIAVGAPGKGGGFNDLPLVNVKAQFLFENESNKRADVQMGFPDQQQQRKGQDRPRSLIGNFSVLIDDVPIQFQKKKGVPSKDDSLPDYEQVFVWSCSFGPREKKKVEVSYAIRMSSLVAFDLADTDEEYELTDKEVARFYRFYREIMPFVHQELQEIWHKYCLKPQSGKPLWMVQSGLVFRTAYILQTGALWKGPIGQALIEVDLSRFLDSVEPLKIPGEQWEGYAFALIKPDGSEWKGKNLIWQMQNVEPEEDIQVGFLTVFYIPRDAATLRRWLATKDGAQLSKSTLTMLKDCVMACHGKASKDPLLKTFFENSTSYQAGKHYLSRTLPTTAREIVAEIDRAITNR